MSQNSINKNKQKGFTLIELSIVIVAIGLIFTGVATGQQMITSSKIRSIGQDYNKVQTAVNIFKVQYGKLPGDFNKAVEYGIGQNNGNGDKRISTRYTEALYFWEQLTKANLFEGSYTGLRSSPNLELGVNMPSANFGKDIAMKVGYVGLNGPGNNGIWAGTQDLFGKNDDFNFLTFAVRSNNNAFADPFLTVFEAQGLDQKIDDGLADSGVLYAANARRTNNNSSRCVNNNTQGNGGASYDFNQEGETCRLIFNIAK